MDDLEKVLGELEKLQTTSWVVELEKPSHDLEKVLGELEKVQPPHEL